MCDSVASKSYMILYGGHDTNVCMDEILSPLNNWDEEYCMDTTSKSYTKESYAYDIKL